jgi:heterodisulfide reductase subunit A-like polyferredoxin
VLRSVAEFSIPTAVASSDFVAVVDSDLCIGCGDCLARCQFAALAVPDEACLVDAGRCVGCGLCATVCPTEALSLQRRPQGEIPPPPDNFRNWLERRAVARGLS